LKKVMAEWGLGRDLGLGLSDDGDDRCTPERTVDRDRRVAFLNTPKNKYLPNGHNYQRSNLPLYLPGNGGLLYAIALMASGWER
jgi:hypothetical protein